MVDGWLAAGLDFLMVGGMDDGLFMSREISKRFFSVPLRYFLVPVKGS